MGHSQSMVRLLCFLVAFALLGCTGPAAESPAKGRGQNKGKQAQEAPRAGAPATAKPSVPPDEAEAPPGETAAPPDEAGAPVAKTLVRDLLAEVGRAELDAGGILVDLGSLDMHKYSRGAWLSGWGRNQVEEETTFAKIRARSAWLDVVSERPVTEIVLRAKGRGSLGVAIGKGAARKASLSKDYGLVRIALPKPLAPGRHRISIVGRKASVDWIWLSEKSGAEAPTKHTIEADALVFSGDRSYSYYLIAERDSKLRFRLRGLSAEVQISAQADGHDPVLLHEGSIGEDAASQVVALPAALTGRPIRLRLQYRGGQAHWHELALVTESGAPSAIAKRPKNVILLLIDTQRADSFSVVNPAKPVGAAAYEALAKSSTTFRNAYNSENWTKPSIATIDTGLYPTTHLARWRKDKCSSDLEFLSEHLKEAGFATGAMVSNKSAGPKFGFDQGWDLFEKTQNAKHAFARALAWLDARESKTPFFLYVQTIDPHVPFSVPEGSAEALFGGKYKGKLGPSFEQSEEDALNARTLKLSEEDARWLRALYDPEVLYHDEHLGHFVQALRERGILEDTAFVILNDHGEEFGENGRWGHGWTMGDHLYRSPLLMHLPGYFPATTVDSVVEHLDVASTIVESLGVAPMKSAEGQSLLPLIHKQEAPGLRSALLFGRTKQRALRVGDYKLVMYGTRKTELYNLAKDPQERTNLLPAQGIAQRLCEVAFGEAIANPKKYERLQDLSEPTKIRAQFISEK